MLTRPIPFFLALFIFNTTVFGQEKESEFYVFYKYKRKTINTRKLYDLYKLAEVITYGKDSELEKVEAIFKWVAVNIDYDYRNDFSTNGILTLDVNKILKKKRGVSFQYARLMDTLCTLNGIKSKSIYGYAKDEFFDVNDSIYHDNHAWNAVKINNQWYLLDAASASGKPFYRYTKFSKLIVQLMNRYAIKYKAIAIRQRKSLFFKYDCVKADSVLKSSPNVRYEPVVKNKLVYNILKRFRLKVVRDYHKEYNPSYFLVQPQRSAIKFHPNNPHWLLTAGVANIKKFETDSSYYHFNDSTINKTLAGGQYCPQCDNELPRDGINYYYDLRQKSTRFNNRNRMVPAFCEYNIAGIKFKEAQKAEDSLTKVTLLDTSLSFFKYAINNIATAQVRTKAENELQKQKNAKKLYLLTDENLNYYSSLKQQINKSYAETKNIRDLRNRIGIFSKMFYNRNPVIRDLINGREIKQSLLASASTVKELQLKEKSLLQRVDSLSTLIESAQFSFDQQLSPLAKQVWSRVFWHDSLLAPLKKSIELRRMMKDNYKKVVVEIRNDYKKLQMRGSADLDSLVYLPASRLLQNGNDILRLMDERYFAHLEIHKIKRQLVKFKVIEPSALDDYRAIIRSENYANFCWTRGGTGGLKQLFYGFESLGQRLVSLQHELENEIRVEGTRYRFIENELYKRNQRLELVMRNNRQILHEKARSVRKYKRDYLRSLREALNEERKKNKD